MRGTSSLMPSPVFDVHSIASGSVGDGGSVEQEIRGAAASCVDDHGVFECGVGEDVAGFDAAVFGHDEGAGGADGDVEPCRGAAGRECGVGDGEAEGFGYDL